MKQRSVWKKILSVVLSAAMVAGMITVSEPQKVEAAESVIWSEDFEDGISSLVAQSDTGASQEIVTDNGKCLKYIHSGWSVLQTPEITISGGKNYQFSYKIKVENSANNIYVRANYEEWTNNEGGQSNYAYKNTWTPDADIVKGNTDGWKTVVLDYTSSVDINRFVVKLEEAYGNVGDIYLDDIKLVEYVQDKELVDVELSLDSVAKEGYLQLASVNNESLITTEYFTVSPSTQYRIEVKRNMENTTGHQWTTLFMWFDGTSGGGAGSATQDGDWTKQTYDFTTDASASSIRINFQLDGCTSTDILLDDIKVYKLVGDAISGSPVYSHDCSAVSGLTLPSGVNTSVVASNIWNLALEGTLDGVSAQYFTAEAMIDGTSTTLYLEKTDDTLVLKESLFTTVPTTSIVIPADTLIVQANPDAGWSEVAGGDRLHVTKEVCIENVDGAWKAVKTTDIELTLDSVSTEGYIEMQGVNNGSAIISDYFTVSPSTQYRIEVKRNMENTTGHQYTTLFMWFDGTSGGSAGNASQDGDWTKQTYDFTTDASASSIRINFQLDGCTTTDILLDDIKVYKLVDGNVSGEPVFSNDGTATTGLAIPSGVSNSIVSSKSWNFTIAGNLDGITGKHFIAQGLVDDVDAELHFERDGNTLRTHEGWFTTAPAKSIELPAGTTLCQADSDNGWATVAGGDRLNVTKKVKVVEEDATWVQVVDPEAVYDNEISFREVKVESDSNNWYFNSTETLPVRGTDGTKDNWYFVATVKVDGSEKKIAIENLETGLVVYGWFFTIGGGTYPETSVEIPAGTVLYEANAVSGWPTIEGGTQIVTKSDILVVKNGDTWEQKTFQEYVISVDFDEVNERDEWLLTSELPATTETYYKANAIVDGELQRVIFEKTETGFTIYAGFFTTAPTSSFKLTKNTVLVAADDKNNWSEIENADSFRISTDLEVNKDGDNWTKYVEPEAVIETQLGIAGVNGKIWSFSSSEKLPSNESAPYFAATIKVDGVDTKVAFANSGSQLVIDNGFFTVYQGKEPQNNLIIPAGTVFYEIDTTTHNWPSVAGGTQIKVTRDLLVEYFAEKWYDCDKVEDNTATPKGFVLDVNESMPLPAGDYTIYSVEENKNVTEINKAGTYDLKYVNVIEEKNASDILVAELANHTNLMLNLTEVKADYWRFLIKEGSVATTAIAGFYMMPVTIDGRVTTVTIEIDESGNFTIWSGFFSTLDSTASVPKKAFKVSAGAVLTPITAYNVTTVDTTRTPIYVQNEITWSKQNVLTTDRIVAYKSYDVNGDGKINSIDLIALKKIETNHPNATTSISGRFCADINRDGTIDREDSLLLRDKFLVDWLAKTSDSSLVFASSDAEMNFFLNDFYMRHMGYEDENGTDYAVTTVKPGEDTTNTFYQEWMTKSLMWYNSKDGLNTDRYAGQKSILENIPVDEFGYVWCDTDEVRPNAAPEADQYHRMGWPFPTSSDANTNGYSTSWTFNADESGKPTWTSSFGAAKDSEQNMMVGSFANQSSISYEVKMNSYSDAITPYFAPWIELDLRMQLENPENVDDVYLYFTTSTNEAFSSTKCVSAKEWAALDYEFTKNYEHLLYFPMYAHNSWGENENPGNIFNQNVNKIYGLKIEIRAKSGKTISGTCGLNSVRSDFDTRHANNQGVFLTSLHEDFSFTGDVEYLKRNLTKARKAMNFYMQMYDTDRNLIYSSYLIGHDGDKTGEYSNSTFNWSTDHKQALIRASAIGNGYWDATYMPEYDFQTNLYFYKGLQSMIALEKYVEENGINISKSEATIKTAARNSGAMGSSTYHYTSADLQAIADKVLAALRADYNETDHTGFYNTKTGRFIAGYDENAGKLYDYGYTQFNTEAIYLGVATETQSESIMDWLDGTRTVSGERYTGNALYTYGFAPRSTTVANADTDDTLFNGTIETDRVDNGKARADEEEVQYGGAMLWTSFYDIMARMKVNGADDAYSRLKEIQSWYSGVYNYYTANAVENTYFYHDYYANNKVGNEYQLLQGGRYGTTATRGGNASGQMGIDSEFAESILLISAIPYGFMGISASTGNTLNISPSLPSSMESLKVENMLFHDVKYDLTAMQDGVRLDAVHGKASGLQVTISLDVQDGQSVYLNGKSTDDYSISNGKAVLTVPMRDTIIQVR